MENRIFSSEFLNFFILRGRFLLVLMGMVTSCITEEVVTVPDSEPTDPVKSGYMKIHLNTPESHMPKTKTYGTRAMDNQAEREIDPEMLNVLVFSCDDDGDGNISEKFYYKAIVNGSVVYDENDGNKAAVVVKLMKSASSNDYYRIVVIANHDMSGIKMVRNVTAKEDILEQLTYSASGKWNADSPDYSLFPMWGEGMPVAITDNMPSPTIDLCRALARIDVGLNFVIDNGKLTEQVYGISDFKLAEVFVFRTYDKGYVAPLSGYAAGMVSVPSGASRHDDNSPLDYIIPVTGGVNRYVREIYVPEADLQQIPDNDNTHCIVVGGYYQNSSVVSYYRLDFAKDVGNGVRDYLPILRNHRYVFNITQVNGPGFSSAVSALKSMPTVGNVNYDLIAWDATIHEMETQGQYYFGIDNRNLLAEAPSTNSAPNNKFTVRYQTNYPLSVADPISLVWASTQDGNGATSDETGASSRAFEAQWLQDGKNILITVNNDNLTSALITDTLYVYAGPFVKKIVVQQKYYDVNYSIDCSSISMKGAYKRGITLNSSAHYITLSITADNRAMQGHSYVIETTDPHNHGIRFHAEGIFDFTGIPDGSPLRIDNICLTGSGTLSAPDEERVFSLPIVSNSPSGPSCEVTIKLAIPRMSVLVISELDSEYGYAISDMNSGAGKILASPNNFGVEDNSIVEVEGFSFISYNSENNSDFSLSTTNDAYKWLTGENNGGKIADIVYLANHMSFNERTSRLLVDYLDKGGVIVAFNEDFSIRTFANTLFERTNISSSSFSPAGSVYPFPANPYFDLSEKDLQNVLHRFEDDPILNGSFGDVRDKQWGEDANTSMHLNNLPSDSDLTVYSYYLNISLDIPFMSMGAVNGFKYESKDRNIIWFGDGGFMASNLGMPLESQVSYPLNWNVETFFPEPKLLYGNVRLMPVYNSVVFCNIMAWAVQKSDSLRGKRNNKEKN